MGMRLHLKYNNLLIWFKYTPLIRNQITHEFIRKSSIIFIRRKKGIWGKLPEAPNATIFGNTKTPHKPSTHVKFHNVTLGDLINNSYHQFGFGDTPYGPSRDDWIYGDHDPDNDVENSMILTNLSKRDKVSTSDISKILSIPNPSSTQGMEELNIDGKLYFQVTPNLFMRQPTSTHIFNIWLITVLMGYLLARMLLPSICPHPIMSTFEA